jgi:hypothetical protein
MSNRKIVQLSIAGATIGGGHMIAAAVADDGTGWTITVAGSGKTEGVWTQLPELPKRNNSGIFDSFAEPKPVKVD